MKKVLLSAVALVAFTFANAQEESKGFGFAKGDVLVEGNLAFGSSKSTDSFNGTDLEETKTSSFTFTPKVGYFVTDKLAVGAELGVGSGKQEVTDFVANTNTENKGNSFGAGVFARYYFLDLGQRFKTYAEAGVGFGSTKWEQDGQEIQKDNSFSLGIDLGINYFVTERFAISFGLNNVLGYSSTKSEFPGGGETKENNFGGNLNTFDNFFDTPSFGLTWKF